VTAVLSLVAAWWSVRKEAKPVDPDDPHAHAPMPSVEDLLPILLGASVLQRCSSVMIGFPFIEFMLIIQVFIRRSLYLENLCRVEDFVTSAK
jgi:hypothetical protein